MRFIFTLATCLLFNILFSQSIHEYCDFDTTNKAMEKIDQMPKFKGCSDSIQISNSIMKYVASRMRYRRFTSEGIVCLTYIVNEKGKVEQVRIIKGANEELDKIAFDVIQNMPRWKPGRHNGEKVKVEYNIPLNFRQPPG